MYCTSPRDEFGNLRVDETDQDVPASDRFSVVLEAVDYDTDNDILGGVYGSAGSGGKVVTGTMEFLPEYGVLIAEYLPFMAGTHLLNVTFQVFPLVRSKAEHGMPSHPLSQRI